MDTITVDNQMSGLATAASFRREKDAFRAQYFDRRPRLTFAVSDVVIASFFAETLYSGTLLKVARASRLYYELLSLRRSLGTIGAAYYFRHFLMHLPEVLATGNLRCVDEAMAHRKWEFNVNGTVVEIEGRHFSQAREMYGRQVYFSRPGFLIRPGDTVVDLGANIGLFSVLAGKCGATAIAVEAQTGYLVDIERNAALNGCRDSIQTVMVMVGSGGVLADSEAVEQASHIGDRPPIRVGVEDLLKTHNVNRVNFLKIDIEGAEFSIIDRDSSWLNCVDKIAMEVHPTFGDPFELRRHLQSFGFSVEFVDNEQRTVQNIENEAGYLFAQRRN